MLINTTSQGGTWGKRPGVAHHLVLCCKLQILVSVKVF